MSDKFSATLTRPDMFAAASKFVEHESGRRYLESIYIHPRRDGRGVMIVATDGKTMFVGHDEKGKASRAGIIHMPPSTKFSAAWKRDCWGDTTRVVTIKNSKAELEDVSKDRPRDRATVAVVLAAEVDATYPDYARMIPKQVQPSLTFHDTSFDPRYHRKIADAFIRCGGSRSAGGAFKMGSATGKADDALLCTRDEIPQLACLLMPVRLNSEPSRPDWLDDYSPAEKAAS